MIAREPVFQHNVAKREEWQMFTAAWGIGYYVVFRHIFIILTLKIFLRVHIFCCILTYSYESFIDCFPANKWLSVCLCLILTSPVCNPLFRQPLLVTTINSAISEFSSWCYLIYFLNVLLVSFMDLPSKQCYLRNIYSGQIYRE